MRLKVIGSGSAGNAYLLYNNKEALLIECGIRVKYIKEALDYDLAKLAGCLISHEHLDHCKSARQLLDAGIDLYSSRGTLTALGIQQHHRCHTVDNQPFQMGNFLVMAFDVKHDAAEPVGFLIEHDETGLILFLTDSYFVPYTFPGLTNIMVEVNYDQEILDAKTAAGGRPAFLRKRIMSSHMNLDTCKDLLLANDLTAVNNILLIHLSDSNADEKKFIRDIYELTGKTVKVANAGMDIEFNKTPF